MLVQVIGFVAFTQKRIQRLATGLTRERIHSHYPTYSCEIWKICYQTGKHSHENKPQDVIIALITWLELQS